MIHTCESATGALSVCSCRPLSRRAALGGLIATAAALPLDTVRAQDQGGRIDTHHHFYPPRVQKAPGLASPLIARWSIQNSLDEMDRNGVRAAALSIASAPLDWFKMEPDASRGFVRDINEFGARMVADHPGRYRLLAFLTMVDVEGSLKEIAYAFDTLKADGVGIPTSYVDKYPGDPTFAPLFEELNRRKALVYFHPTTSACCLGAVPNVGDSWIEVPHDTTRAVVSLLFSGSLRKYRDIRFPLVAWRRHAADAGRAHRLAVESAGEKSGRGRARRSRA